PPSSPTPPCSSAMSPPATSIANRRMRSSRSYKASTASTVRPSSWSPTIPTPPPALRAPFISTKAAFPRRNPSEIPPPHLEQPQAKEAPHLADDPLHLRRLRPLRPALRHEGSLHRGRQHGRRRPPHRPPQSPAHHDPPHHLSTAHRANPRRQGSRPPHLVQRHLQRRSQKLLRHLPG